MREELRRAGLRHRQARQPLRRGAGRRPLQAYSKAFQTDPTSAFGGIIAFNRPLDGAAAEAVAKQFVELLIAPAITPEARAVFAAKQNVRLLEVPLSTEMNGWDMQARRRRPAAADQDAKNVTASELRVVTKGRADAGQMQT
jgi:phosphoribosylaminoimidazolecarboxamide formyltransferase/IMP cyclohydrolase